MEILTKQQIEDLKDGDKITLNYDGDEFESTVYEVSNNFLYYYHDEDYEALNHNELDFEETLREIYIPDLSYNGEIENGYLIKK